MQEKTKRATVGPLPGVTQDIAGFKVIFYFRNTLLVLVLTLSCDYMYLYSTNSLQSCEIEIMILSITLVEGNRGLALPFLLSFLWSSSLAFIYISIFLSC